MSAGIRQSALVTGATGFIGKRLVRELLAKQIHVRALVRSTSDTSWLEQQGCEIVVSDLLDPSGLAHAVRDDECVFHLAAETNAVRSKELIARNGASTRHLIEAMAGLERPGRLVYVSSLAAVGPTSKTEPLKEGCPYQPVSFYGKSKAACERTLLEYADRVPISIVRPPIVLGQGDHNGLAMFKAIDSIRLHFVPGFINRHYSVIHVDDLVQVLLTVAEQGERGGSSGGAEGIYFAASDETFTFSELGRLIGRAMGRKAIVIKVAKPVVWLTCVINEGIARLTKKSQYLDLDKFREGFSGSWICSNAKMKRELGVAIEHSMTERLEETVAWYRREGWLPSHRATSVGDVTPAADQAWDQQNRSEGVRQSSRLSSQ